MSEDTEQSFVPTLAQQGGVMLVGKLGGRVFSFLFLVFVTRAVAPNVYGKFTLALAVVSIVKDVFNFNLHQSVDYFLPKAISDGERTVAMGIVGFVSQVVLLGATVGVIALVLLRGRIASFFETPALAPLLGVMALIVLFQSLVGIQEKAFSSLKRIEYRVMVSDLGFPVLKLLFVATLVVAGYDAYGLAVGHLAALVVGFSLGAYLLWRRTALPLSIDGVIRPSFSQKRELFDYAFPLYLTGIIYAVSGQISYLVLGFFLGPSEVAVYRVAYQLTINLTIVNLAIAPVFKPMVSAADDRLELRAQYRLATRWVIMLTVPLVAVLIAAPEVYLRFLFSSDYTTAVVAVVPLTLGHLFNSFSGPEAMLLEGTGHTRVTLFNGLVMVGLNVALLLLLVPTYGVLGAGVAAGLTLALLPALAVGEIHAFEAVHPFTLDHGRFLAAGLVAGAVAFGVSRAIPPAYVVAFLLPPLTLLVYVVGVRLLGGFSSEEQRIAREIDERLGYTVFERFV